MCGGLVVAVGHGYATDLEAVLLAQAHRLVRVLGDPGADQGVVLLRRAFGNAVVDERLGAVAQAAEGDEALADLFVGEHGVSCGGSEFLEWGSQAVRARGMA
jgi:hypothetical protein